VASLEKINNDVYQDDVEKIDYWRYVQSADYHYFISRVLFHHHIGEYSNFSGHQCLEIYQKAYLKYKNQSPPNSHDLFKLLERCKSIAPNSNVFIHSDELSVIVKKYAPFYELARYPVQKQRPKKGQYMNIFPDDIYLLDYFVMRMREILTIPSNTWDILKDGHYNLYQTKELFPSFYNTFFEGNINFTK